MAEIFQEIDDDIRRERYEKLWARYGKYVIGAIVLFVIVAALYVAWQNYSESKRNAEGERFAAAIELTYSGAWDRAASSFGKLADSTRSGYRPLSLLQQAAALIEAGRQPEAMQVYQELSVDSDSEKIYRDLGALLAVIHSFEDRSDESVRERLALLASEDGPWRYSAKELEAYRRLQTGETEEAQKLFQLLADDLGAPMGIRSRAAEVLAVISGS